MLNSITGLINAHFAVRCFLPFLSLFIGGFLVNDVLMQTDYLLGLIYVSGSNRVEALAGSAFIGVVAWVGGVLIEAIQREIIRILEGYGKYNPFVLIKNFKRRQIKKYNDLKQRKNTLEMQLTKFGFLEAPKDIERELNEIARKLFEYYPENEFGLLPTSFGNVIKAYETYSLKMYGLDGVAGWTRLEALIPQEYQKSIDDARLIRDFWVNMWFVSWLLFGEVVFLLIFKLPYTMMNITQAFIMAFALLFLGNAANAGAISGALGFGQYVRSAYDLFIDDLGLKLKVPRVVDLRTQSQLWNDVSHAFTFGCIDSLDDVRKFQTTLENNIA